MTTTTENTCLEKMLKDFESLVNGGFFKEYKPEILNAIAPAIIYGHSLSKGASLEMEDFAKKVNLDIPDTYVLVLKVIFGYLTNPAYGFYDMVFKTPDGYHIASDWMLGKIHAKTDMDEYVEYGDESFLFSQVEMSLIRNERV